MSEETNGVTPEQAADVSAEAPAVEEPKVHPAWDKMLNELPEAWHSKVAPYLQEHDKNVQSQLEKFTPFKEYVDQGVSADLIASGINLARAIETQPLEVFSSLRDYLIEQGAMPAEAAQQAAEIMEDQSGQEVEDIFDTVPKELRSKIDELEEFKSRQEQLMYEQEMEKATAQYTSELEAEMATLRQSYQITEQHEIAMYDLMNAALNAGREITLADAAKQLQGMVGTFQPVGATSSEPAPMIVGSAGGAGVLAPNIGVPKDDRGKKEMLAKMFAEYSKASQ